MIKELATKTDELSLILRPTQQEIINFLYIVL